MKVSSGDLQRVVFAALSGEITGTVHDAAAVPAGQAFPYTVIGASTAVPFDTHTEDGAEETVTITTFDNAKGSTRVKGIMSEIVDTLQDLRFTLNSGETGWFAAEFADVSSYPIGNSIEVRGVLRFRAFYS